MKHKFSLGALTIDAQAYGSQGNAILGIRDSGKTYTATEIAEHLFDAGVPFITFDPTGVWRFLRVPGAGRGYPIVVAGGKSADLPLTPTGAVEIVRAAMKNGVSLVIDLTDPSLSKANWRRIVKSCVSALLQENEPHGLRHIFIEEAAEFVPQKVLDGDVYAEIVAILGSPADKLLDHLAGIYPENISREGLASACGLSINTNSVKAAIVRLKDMGFAIYPESGFVRADASLFPERRAAA